MNLDGWTLSDEDGHTYTFNHYRLDGRSTARVHIGSGRDTYRDVYQDRRNYEGRGALSRHRSRCAGRGVQRPGAKFGFNL
ncbi:hypothetical protein ACIOTI_39570 [Streptomyces sp. NPDC087843]|uniref:hypothetical protein n=1 Tax=Streptomyces sp. NPDC087843 TaxID=3365804 RepID=UPI0037FFDD27